MNIVTEYPLWLVFVCLLAGLGFAFLLYRAQKSDISKKVTWMLFAFRALAVAFLCFFLLNPLIKSTSTFDEKPVIVLAVDNSVSVTRNKDSAFYRQTFPSLVKDFQDKLADKYEVHFLRFDAAVDEDSALKFNGKQTNISNLLTQVRNDYEGKNLGAVILATDGLYNTGSNPLFEVEKNSFPVFTVALGDTVAQKDALVKKISHNQTAYIGNQFPVEVQLQANDLKGQKATVTISQEGQKIAEQQVAYTSSNYSSVLNFLLSANKAGLQRYQVDVSLAAGEQVKTNNHGTFVIDVIDKREKILIIAGAPHPDVSALKLAIEQNQSYEVEVKLAENFNTSLKPYSLVILHRIELKNTVTRKIQAELAQHKTSSWQFSVTDFWAFPGLRLSGVSPRMNDAEPSPNEGFSLFNISNDLKHYAHEFPAVNCALANYKLAAGTSILFTQQIGQVKTENPILVFADEAGQKTALFCADGLWRWRLRDYADHENTNIFDELVQKTVQYLSVKADKSFFKVYGRRLLNENEAIEFDAEVFNPSYELVTDQEVNITITDETKKQFNYTFSKSGSGYHLNAGNFPPGKYTYRAQVKSGAQVYEQRGEFTVKQLTAEYTQSVADHAMLYALSRKTGGEMIHPASLPQLAEKLLHDEHLKTLVHEQRQVNDFINLRVLFFVLLVFLSTEWFVRKYSGLY